MKLGTPLRKHSRLLFGYDWFKQTLVSTVSEISHNLDVTQHFLLNAYFGYFLGLTQDHCSGASSENQTHYTNELICANHLIEAGT